MSNLFPDTQPEAEAVLIRLLREAPPWRKLAMVWQMNAAVKTMMLSGLRERFPKETPEMLQRRLAELLLGEELAQKVYGPLSEDLGNEISDRQWRDILGVLKVQAGRLDMDYLRKWAAELQVADLLQRALKESE
jgi:hypothetical protein